MNDISLIALLERSLPVLEVPWVLAALRQDDLIWNCVAGPTGFNVDLRARVLAQGTGQVDAWSPAALALIALDLPHTPQSLCADINYPLESRLRRKIAQAASAHLAQNFLAERNDLPDSGIDVETPGVEDLARAGLLALALRERRRLMGSWQGLPDDLEKINLPASPSINPAPRLPRSFWKTPLACLFGMVPDPLDMLVSLTTPGAMTEQHPLVVHALLANPLSPEKSSQIFQQLLSRISRADGIVLLRELAYYRPEMAARAARIAAQDIWRSETPIFDDHLPLDPLDDIRRLDWLIGQLLIKKVAADLPESLPLLDSARETAFHLHTELIAQRALALQKEDLPAALEAWEQAVRSAPDNPHYRLGLVLALLDAGRLEEARQWLAEEGDSAGAGNIPGEVQANVDCAIAGPAYLHAFAAARLAAANGNVPQARELSIKMLATMLRDAQITKSPFQLLAPTAIPRFLLDIGLSKQAAEAIHFELNSRPEDLELLSLEGEAWCQAGQIDQALIPLQMAVNLAPERVSSRRQYAAALENQAARNTLTRELWEAALHQRAAVCVINASSVALGTNDEGLSPARLQALDDLRLWAGCALHAGKPQQAIDACQQALILDAEDGISHTLLGQALAAAGDLPAAREHLLQATRLNPALVESWLTLARVLHQSSQALRALEILRSAAQANPESPEILLALGEAYLEDWEGRGAPSPTQALGYFQQASALAPDNVQIAFHHGQTLYNLGHLLEARQTLEGAYLAEPGFPGLALIYAQTLLALGESVQALPVLTRVIADPAYTKDPGPHMDYARILLAVKTARGGGEAPRQAVQSLRHVLSLDPGCAEAQALLGEALAASGDMPAAMQAFQLAMDTSLGRDPAWKARLSLGLGQVALALGQNDTAMAALQEASNEDPLDPAIALSLAEACYAAGLPENALQAARTALRLAPDDADILAWFAEQAIQWVRMPETVPFPTRNTLNPLVIEQLRTEALNALTRAIHIDSQRADLLVSMGRVQWMSGEKQAALETLHQLTASQSAEIRDLEEGANLFLEMGDAASAVACLEKALVQYQRVPSGQGPSAVHLQILLASAYEKAGNLAAALSILDSALVSTPEDLSLYREKARLLMALNRPEETLACLEAALSLAGIDNPDACDLRYQAACLLRLTGSLPEALSLAESILSSSDRAHPGPYSLSAQVLAAELANSLLLRERARAFLGASPASSQGSLLEARNEKASRLPEFEYFCLRAELALDWNDEHQAIESLAKANEAIPAAMRTASKGGPSSRGSELSTSDILQSRLLALQARLSILAGDANTARNMVQEASRLVKSAKAAHVLLSLPGLLSLGEASLQTGIWDLAIEVFQTAVEMAPYEPYPCMCLARSLVLRAERERLYSALEVVKHAPGSVAVSKQAAADFDHAIDNAHQCVIKWLAPEGSQASSGRKPTADGKSPWMGVRSAPYRRSDIIQAQTMISRWRARGQAVFQPGPHSAQALSATLAVLPSSPEDAAAQIAALRYALIQPTAFEKTSSSTTSLPVSNPADIAIQAARAFPQHPLVLVQLGLILYQTDIHDANHSAEQMREAYDAALEAVKCESARIQSRGGEIEDSHLVEYLYAKDCLWPVCNVLLATIAGEMNKIEEAQAAIGEALACWPEEPRWQAMAARFDREQGALESAIVHLEQAVILEQDFLHHYLALGEVYLAQAGHFPAGERSENNRVEARNNGHQENQLYRQAIQTLEAACRLAPEKYEVWLALAEAQQTAGFLGEAAVSAEKAIELIPYEAGPQIMRARIALQAEQPQVAYEHVMAAMRLDGWDSKAVNNEVLEITLLLSRTLDQLDRPKEALNVLEKALPKAAQPLPLMIERVNLLRKIHGSKAATEALQKLALDYPDQAEVLAPLSYDLAATGQKEAAIRAAQMALQTAAHGNGSLASVDEAKLHTLLGRLFNEAGQLDSAIHHLNEAIRLAPNVLEPYLELGRALQDRRQHSQALQIYSQATRIAPQDHRPYYQAGLALKEGKDYMGAENMLRRASALAPNDLNIHRQLGAVVALNLVHNRVGVKRAG